jgi:hypothetical protein
MFCYDVESKAVSLTPYPGAVPLRGPRHPSPLS